MRLVRSIAISAALLLVFAFTAGAQLVGPEVSSTPFLPQSSSVFDRFPLARLARFEQSAVAVWPVVNAAGTRALMLARLDGQLHAVVAREVPSFVPAADCTAPSVASDGANILVVWSEPAGVAMALFDRNLEVIGEPKLLTPGDYAGHAAVDRGSFVVVVNKTLYRFQRTTFSNPASLTVFEAPGLGAMDDVVVSPTYGVQVATFSVPGVRIPDSTLCPPRYLCNYFTTKAVLFFMMLYSAPVQAQLDETVAEFRAMATADKDTLVISRTTPDSSGELRARLFSGPDAAISRPLSIDGAAQLEPTSASATWDGERYAVVWQAWTGYTAGQPPQRNHGVGFATIENGAITRRSILVDSMADELRPSILAIGAGRYIVAYDTVTNGEHRLAGRLVSLQQDARRRPSGK